MSEKEKIKRFMRDLGNALARFKEVTEVSLEENEFAIEATIQCFEFSFELFWKTLKLLLQENVGVEVRGPKPVLIEAYAQEWVNDEKKWIDLLDARNLTSHVYNEQRAQEIYEMILKNASMMHIDYAALKERFADYLK